VERHRRPIEHWLPEEVRAADRLVHAGRLVAPRRAADRQHLALQPPADRLGRRLAAVQRQIEAAGRLELPPVEAERAPARRAVRR